MPDAAWRLLWALNSIKNVQEEILIEHFYETLKAPADDVIALLHALPDSSQALAHPLGTNHLLYNLQGFQLHYAHYLLPTCTINLLASQDETPPQLYPRIPARSIAEITFHLLPNQDPTAICALLRRHLDIQGFSDVQLKTISACPAYHISLEDPFTQTILQATSIASGRKPYVLPFTSESHPIHRLHHALQIPIVITAMNTFGITSTTWPNEKLKQVIITTIKQIILTLAAMSR